MHGGDKFADPTLVTDDVVDTLRELSPLAPLHNPAGISGIEAARKLLPDVPHVAIFDTAFFARLPAEAFTYAMDVDLAKRTRIRKYGFHGTSHRSSAARSRSCSDSDDLKQIVCHLGNGASVSAVDSGHAIETSMGLTPLAGLVMGTRSGDIDPGIVGYLSRELGLTSAEIDDELNKRSGMLGLTGHTDMRDVEAAINAGNEQAQNRHGRLRSSSRLLHRRLRRPAGWTRRTDLHRGRRRERRVGTLRGLRPIGRARREAGRGSQCRAQQASPRHLGTRLRRVRAGGSDQ